MAVTREPASVAAPDPDPPHRRILSVDALRGFDMFWIIGGDQLVRSLVNVRDCRATRALAAQMEHRHWAGLHFYDVIFPLFVWIVGVSIALSLPRLIRRYGRRAAVKRVVIRSVVLFLLGIFYMGGVANGFANVYLAGVLQRIAVAYLFGALLFCFFSPRALAVWAGVLLVGYWALMTFVPVPGIGSASYEQGKNLAFYIDQHWLPGRKFEGTLLSTMPAVANCILGIFGGLLLSDVARREQERVRLLLAAGALCLVAGLVWSLQFPIIKLLWTSSYVLVACGISAILLALFHQVIEVWQRRTWCQPLVWIGANAITIYLASSVANFRGLAERVVGGDVAVWLGPYAESVTAVVALAIALWLVRFLHRRQIFLRL